MSNGAKSSGPNKVGFFTGVAVGSIQGEPYVGTRRDDSGSARFVSVRLRIPRWRKRNGKDDLELYWLQVVFFGDLAAAVEGKLRQGNRLFASGRMEQSKFVDKHGAHHLSYRMIVQDFQFLEKFDSDQLAKVADTACDRNHASVNTGRRYRGSFA